MSHTQSTWGPCLLALAAASCAVPRGGHAVSAPEPVATPTAAPLAETEPAELTPAMAAAMEPEPEPAPVRVPPPPLVHAIEPAAGPCTLTVEVGQELVFVNRDEICHGLFSSSAPNAFDTGLLQPRGRASVHFAHPGPVQVYCSLHDHRQLTIHVIPLRTGR